MASFFAALSVRLHPFGEAALQLYALPYPVPTHRASGRSPVLPSALSAYCAQEEYDPNTDAQIYMQIWIVMDRDFGRNLFSTYFSAPCTRKPISKMAGWHVLHCIRVLLPLICTQDKVRDGRTADAWGMRIAHFPSPSPFSQ